MTETPATPRLPGGAAGTAADPKGPARTDRKGLARRAEEVMTPGVVTLPVTASLDRTAKAMAAHNVHGVLVVSTEGRPCGWVTSDRITSRVGKDNRLEWAVDAIGEPFVAVAPDASMREVVAKLREAGVRRVAVQSRPGLLPEGVISNIDIAGLV